MEMDTPGHLVGELLAMAQADQDMRARFIDDETAWDDSIDERNMVRLGEIIDRQGWPTIQNVGAEASHAAWLIAQHAPDLEFMKLCLELMKALPEGAIDPANAAYLEDRVLTMQDRAQIYGTQFHEQDGKLVAFPIIDPGSLDERRASVGLNPYAENEAELRELYKNPD